MHSTTGPGRHQFRLQFWKVPVIYQLRTQLPLSTQYYTNDDASSHKYFTGY